MVVMEKSPDSNPPIVELFSWPPDLKFTLKYLHEFLEAASFVDFVLKRRHFVKKRTRETLDRCLVKDQPAAVTAEESRQVEHSAY